MIRERSHRDDCSVPRLLHRSEVRAVPHLLDPGNGAGAEERQERVGCERSSEGESLRALARLGVHARRYSRCPVGGTGYGRTLPLQSPGGEMDQVARVVLALEAPEVAEEVMHFLDRSGRARVVATAGDDRQLAEAVRQLEPDAVVAEPGLLAGASGVRGSDRARRPRIGELAPDRDPGGSRRVLPVAEGTRRAPRGHRGRRPAGAALGQAGHGAGGPRRPRWRGCHVRGDTPRRRVRAPRLGRPDRRRPGVR